VNALEIIGVNKFFKGKKGTRVEALTNLDLKVLPGEVFGFLGPNGAGKSTTIKTLMSLIKPTSGMAYVFGIPVTDSAARLKIGYLPENPTFYDFMTAREYLFFVGRAFMMADDLIRQQSDSVLDLLELAGSADRPEYLFFVGRAFMMADDLIRQQSDSVLDLLELAGSADRPIRGYSKGMVQRLGIAQTLLHDPDIYILDEPMSGLDPIGRALVKEIIKNLKQRGKTVFFSTHITADVEVVCDRVGVIVKGKLQVVDRVDRILQNGIEGYILQVNRHDTLTEEVFVERSELKAFINEIVASDATIERIEPKRKDLEAFFLNIVSRGDKGDA